MTTAFNNLLKVVLNIESDSEELQKIQSTINFAPRMLTSANKPATINEQGLLFPTKMNMKRLYKPSSIYNENCSEYPAEKEDFLKRSLIQNWLNSYPNNIEEDLVKQFHPFQINPLRDEKTIEENIKSNIDFLVCLFFKNYESLTGLNGINDNNVYIILNKKLKESAIKITNSAPYESTYEITLSLTLIDLFKPSYLRLNLNVAKPSINALFLPTMDDEELEEIEDPNMKVSLFFSPFIPLSRTVLKTPLLSLENRKLFTDEKEMRKWIKTSFLEDKKRLYNWTQTQNKDIPKNNMKLIIQLFLDKSTVLTIGEKDYEIVSSHTIISDPIFLTNKFLRLVCDYTVNNTITLRETTKNNLIVLDIKLLLESMNLSNKKIKKEKKDFLPKMVNKSIGENIVYFSPYLELPSSLDELEKLNENYMRLFTMPTEFLKLIKYLRHTSKAPKKYDLKNPVDRRRIDEIVEKNIKTMIKLFFPQNGELFLNREIMNAYTQDTKNFNKEEKRFYISKSDFKPPYIPSTILNSSGLPTKYTITVDITLSESPLTALDFYKLSCKEKTTKLDDKLEEVIESAYASSYASGKPRPKKTTYFTDLMQPDEQVDTSLQRMRPALMRSSLKNGGRGLRNKKGIKRTIKKKKHYKVKKNKTRRLKK